jgi:hypothetical protein
MIGHTITQLGCTLGALTRSAAWLKPIYKTDLAVGDWILVTTVNSSYSIQVLEDGLYSFTGGWVDQQGLSPLETTITGCPWGGSSIKFDVVAACGLRLEFGNRIVTTTIQKVVVVRSGESESIN